MATFDAVSRDLGQRGPSPLSRLIAAHPALFRGQPPETFSDLPPGWFDLVDDLCGAIEEALGREAGPRFRVLQIKEKLGGLRFYWRLDDAASPHVDITDDGGRLRGRRDPPQPDPARQAIQGLVAEAERRSEAVCMTCGGRRHDDGGLAAA